jgi:hypothetical protein
MERNMNWFNFRHVRSQARLALAPPIGVGAHQLYDLLTY